MHLAAEVLQSLTDSIVKEQASDPVFDRTGTQIGTVPNGAPFFFRPHELALRVFRWDYATRSYRQMEYQNTSVMWVQVAEVTTIR